MAQRAGGWHQPAGFDYPYGAMPCQVVAEGRASPSIASEVLTGPAVNR